MDIDKIRDEMAKSAGNAAIRQVGEYVTTRVMGGATLAEGKTLQGAYKAMEEHARKNKQGSSYCMTDEEARGIIDRYFGFDPQAAASAAPKAAEAPVEEPKKRGALDDLDALLEGL